MTRIIGPVAGASPPAWPTASSFSKRLQPDSTRAIQDAPRLYLKAGSWRKTLGDLTQFAVYSLVTPRKLLILKGEMAERLKAHAWKAIRATLTE
jgi:hypothetical protein